MKINKTTTNSLFSEFPPVKTQQWQETILKDLKGADYEKKLIWKTNQVLEIKPYYRSEDISDFEFPIVAPGDFPYVRGNKSTDNDWIIREDILESDPKKANVLALDAIKRGAQAIGFNVKGIHDFKEFNILFKNIDLSKTEIHFTSAVSFPQLIDNFLLFVKNNNIHADKIVGSINFDPISYSLLNGKPYDSLEKNDAEAFQLIQRMHLSLPKMKVITINGQFFNNAGASIIQELAYSLASGNEYLSSLTSLGADIDEVAPDFQFCLGIGSNYFLEIAKIFEGKDPMDVIR